MKKFRNAISGPLLASLFLIGAVVALAGCGPAPDARGHPADKLALHDIKPGVSDKAAVTKLLGSPSSIATFDNDTWYYISQETRNVAFFKPELMDEHVVAINFDNRGVVQKVSLLDMKDHQVVEPDPNATPAPGREFTILEQLIGNFGRFSGEGASSNSGSTAEPGPGH
jgi:outer membrane protein assembly factor BamE (lipoprotein component of BamABCDE complex)